MMKFETDKTADSLPGKNGHTITANSAASSQEGVLPVCKPEGISSFRMVQLVRSISGIKKVGHTGTLDPFASGVLVICAGRSATKLIPQLMEGDKEYEATLQLGVITDTQDPEGQIVAKRPVPDFTEKEINACLSRFTGEQLQTPPSYSALKHKGKPMYYYARRGIKVTKEPRLIIIKELECLARHRNSLVLRVVCSKGTYIRTLGADIGEYLGCGAHLKKLKRTRNGLFSLAQTLDGERLFPGKMARSMLELHRMPVDTVKELLADNRESN